LLGKKKISDQSENRRIFNPLGSWSLTASPQRSCTPMPGNNKAAHLNELGRHRFPALAPDAAADEPES
jgi:hypothetical protein